MPEPVIEPGTDAFFKIRVKVGGVLKDDATATATIYNPQGQLVVANQSLVPVGNSTGEYTLAIAPAWSISGSKYIEGEFLARVKVIRGSTRIRDFRYNVQFGATT